MVSSQSPNASAPWFTASCVIQSAALQVWSSGLVPARRRV
jgi:hypothetical protein